MLNQPVVGGGGGGLTTAQVQALIDASALWQDIGARVRRSTNQAVNSGSVDKMAYNTEDYDTDTIHDTGSNTERLTCRTAGKYWIYASIAWSAHASGRRYCDLYLNNTTDIARSSVPTVGGSDQTEMHVATEYELDVGDYIEVRVFQNSGAQLNVVAQAEAGPIFGMRLVAPPG